MDGIWNSFRKLFGLSGKRRTAVDCRVNHISVCIYQVYPSDANFIRDSGDLFRFSCGQLWIVFFEYQADESDIRLDVQKKENTAVLLLFEGEPDTYDLPLFLKNISQTNNFIDIEFSIKINH